MRCVSLVRKPNWARPENLNWPAADRLIELTLRAAVVLLLLPVLLILGVLTCLLQSMSWLFRTNDASGWVLAPTARSHGTAP